MKINNIQTLADWKLKEQKPEVVFWVGCAGSFDSRAIKVTKAFVSILQSASITFAILGQEEQCTGDPARRSGNEFLFQLLANQNIQNLNKYQVQKIVTTCPHCFNTLKNEYPELGGHYEVLHHTEFINELLKSGRLKIKGTSEFKGKKITYHDSCYLGRANGIYEAPRSIIEQLDLDLVELKRCKSNGLCCGAGGAQMFKEEEEGKKRINEERTQDIMESKASIVTANCPFCITMLNDGIKSKGKEEDILVLDLAELILNNIS